jgi:hypothetical protein
VPRAVYDAICEANSAGRVFNTWIKGRYECRFDPERKRFGPKAWPRGNPDPSCDFCEEREADRADDSERGGADRNRVACGEGY